jgi:hypothetical protein
MAVFGIGLTTWSFVCHCRRGNTPPGIVSLAFWFLHFGTRSRYYLLIIVAAIVKRFYVRSWHLPDWRFLL